MPYDLTIFSLPSGAKASRADLHGVITREDADMLMRSLGAGGSNFGIPLYVATERMTRMNSEARSIFSVPPDPAVREQWCAVMVTSPVIRVTINFLLRVSGSKKVKIFSSEAVALAWLDERVREDAAKKDDAAT